MKLQIVCLFTLFFIIFVLFKRRIKESWNTNVCQIKPPPESDRILVDVVKHYKPRFDDLSYQKIPRIIIQTNEKDKIPLGMSKSMKKLADMNPEYQYFYFDNNDVTNYLLTNFGDRILRAYNKLKPGAYKADFFRYCFLYNTGGVYIDSPMCAIERLSSFIRSDDEFISPEDNTTGGIYNAFICCVPNHPIMKRCIEVALYNIENEIYGDCDLSITGPKLLSRVFEDFTGQKVEADKKYGNGIRLINHIAVPRSYLCFSFTVGYLIEHGKKLFLTRYPLYYIDRLWYNTSDRYSKLWEDRNVFHR